MKRTEQRTENRAGRAKESKNQGLHFDCAVAAGAGSADCGHGGMVHNRR